MRKDEDVMVYRGGRPEIVGLVPADARKVLDVGCSAGDVGLALKDKCPCEVTGIEMDERLAEEASSKIDRVITGDIETVDPGLEEGYFDHILFADVLEHLKDPLEILKRYTRYLKDDGKLVISVPNVRHISVLCELVVRGEWEYRQSGIMDNGHLRFFTRKSFTRLLGEARLSITGMERIFSLKGSRALNLLTLGLFLDTLTAQYVFIAEKAGKSNG